MKTLLFLLLFLGMALPPLSAEDGADPLAIAAVLIRDGNYARAEAVLQPVNPNDKGVDRVRYYTLTGLVALRSSRYSDAEAAFRLAQSLGQKDTSLTPYLAQALFGQQKYADTLAVLQGFQRLTAFPDLMGMKSQSEWLLGRRSEALTTLDRAIQTYPKQLAFLQTKMAYMLELGLTQEAASLARAYLDRAGANPTAWLTVGESLRRAHQLKDAILVLESARLQFPDATKVGVALAQAYWDSGLQRTAAELLERVAAADATYLLPAAEWYRKAKAWDRALYLNGLVSDTTAKTRQRFGILVDASRFEEAAALVPRLDRLGLLEEPRLQYAAAYVNFRAQRFTEAQRLLLGLQDPSLFGASVQLRRAMDAARAEKTLYF